MHNKVKLMVPVEIHLDELVDTIHSSIDHDDVPDFIKELDLRYQDFEVTEKTIIKLLDSLRGEFVASYGEPSTTVEQWDLNVSRIKTMMIMFE